jgi:hypothetical protein
MGAMRNVRFSDIRLKNGEQMTGKLQYSSSNKYNLNWQGFGKVLLETNAHAHARVRIHTHKQDGGVNIRTEKHNGTRTEKCTIIWSTQISIHPEVNFLQIQTYFEKLLTVHILLCNHHKSCCQR